MDVGSAVRHLGLNISPRENDPKKKPAIPKIREKKRKLEETRRRRDVQEGKVLWE